MEPTVVSRPASTDDVEELVRLYGRLAREMDALESMWSLADGLPEPIGAAFAAAIEDDETVVRVGSIDGVAVGFVLARVEPLLPHTDEVVGAIHFVFTEPEARGVGVGEAMRDDTIEDLRARGVGRFDAHVLPGHRLAKNFFEAGGFSARHIVMYHEDDTP